MIDSVSARQYLEAALPFGQWQAASRAIGHDHAYIQQYIRRGVPRWLKETDRELLVALYELDADRLRPPSRSTNLTRFRVAAGNKPPRDGDKQANIDFPGLNEVISEPGVVELVGAYMRIAADKDKKLAVSMVTALSRRAALRPRSGSDDVGSMVG